MLNLWIGLGVVLLALATTMTIVLGTGFRTVAVPSCRRCLYNLTGLSSHVCPECGADLQGIGILQSGDRKPIRMLGRIILLSLFVAGMTSLIAPVVASLLPYPRTQRVQVVLSSPQSRAYSSLSISGERTSRLPRPAPVRHVSVTLTKRDGSTNEVQVDLNTATAADRVLGKRYHWNLAEPSAAADAILIWLKAHGVSGADDVLWQEAGEVGGALRNVENVRSNPNAPMTWTSKRVGFNTLTPFGSTAVNSSSTPATDYWRPVIVFGPFMFAWLVGLTIIVWACRPSRTQIAATYTVVPPPVIAGQTLQDRAR